MASDLVNGLLPEHILLALILLLMVLEMFKADTRLSGFLFVAATAAGAAVIATQLLSGYSAVVVPQEVQIDRFALLSRLVILGCGVVLGLCSRTSGHKYWMLLASSILGALIIMDSAGFITLFLGIEMLSLPAFALMVTGCGVSRSSEGAFKYLLLSSVASALILFGLSLAYATTGSLAIEAFVAAVRASAAPAIASCLLILTGFFLKAALFPFHAWAPDAYSSARVQVTSFLASIVKGTVILALVRVTAGITFGGQGVVLITVLSLASIFYGNLTAIKQGAFKRLLAYSSVAHAGYMIFALTDSSAGRAESLLYYVAVYAVTTIVACASFNLICTRGGDCDDLSCLDGAFASRPLPSILLALSALSMAGIPPLPGFLAKFLIFKSVIASGHLTAAVLAFTASYIGVIFYLGLVLRIFSVGKEAAPRQKCACECGGGYIGLLLGTVCALVLILVPGIFRQLL